MKHIKNLTLVPYSDNLYNNYNFEAHINKFTFINTLNIFINDTRLLNWISDQYKLNKEQRDFIITFKKFSSNEMFDFNETIFEKKNVGKWYNYSYTLASNEIITLKSLYFRYSSFSLAHDNNVRKSLFIFWRLIANNLDNNTFFKIGFKVLFKVVTHKESDHNDPKDIFKTKIIEDKDIFIVRTISPIQIYNKTNLKDCYEMFVKHIETMSEQYHEFDIHSIIFPFCINKDDSILNKKIESQPEEINKLSDENLSKIKNKLKLGSKNFPKTTNLNEWGNIKIEKGTYPLNKNLLIKETKVLINVKNQINNYVVFIKKIKFNGKIYLVQKVSVVNKQFLEPINEFIDIIDDLSNLNNFTRIIKNQIIVYKNNEVVYNQNRHTTNYFTTIKKCDGVSKSLKIKDLILN